MRYNSIYKKIIERAKNREEPVFYEKHHILPKAFGGSDDKENLVKLTPREHYICHLLLYRMSKGNKRKEHQMLTAVMMLRGKYVTSGRLYESARKKYIDYKKEASKGKNNPMFGKKHSDETKRKISEKAKNRKSPHPMKGRKHSQDSIMKNKLSNSLKIQIFDENDRIMFESNLKFEDFCNDNSLPFKSFKKSYQKDGEPIYMSRSPRKSEWLRYKGWYAKSLS